MQIALDIVLLSHGCAATGSLRNALPHREAPLKVAVSFPAASQPPGGSEPLLPGQFSMVSSAVSGFCVLSSTLAHALPHVINETPAASRALPMSIDPSWNNWSKLERKEAPKPRLSFMIATQMTITYTMHLPGGAFAKTTNSSWTLTNEGAMRALPLQYLVGSHEG